MARPKMIIGMHLGNGYGSQSGARCMPWPDPGNYARFARRAQDAKDAADPAMHSGGPERMLND